MLSKSFCSGVAGLVYGSGSLPLTLALSRRERELAVADVRDPLTWDIELYSGFEQPAKRLPLPLGEGWGEGALDPMIRG